MRWHSSTCSVFSSLLGAGLILSSDYLVEKMDWLSGLKDLAQQRNLRIGVGIAAGVVGILKLIVRAPGETVPVAGDLLPALAGIALGGLLLADTFRVSRDDEPAAVDKVTNAVMPYRTPIGLGGIVVALVHFILPSLIIL
jgi:hypothetical protein